MTWKAPTTFAEYIERFPDWHKKWLSKYFPMLSRDEDTQQHLVLRTLMAQRVEKYDPTKLGGKDSIQLFLHWMGLGFRNDMRTRHHQAQADKRSHESGKSDVSMEELTLALNREGGSGDAESLAFHSSDYRDRAESEGRVPLVHAQLKQFRSFVSDHRPDLLPLLEDMELNGGVSNDRARFTKLAQQMLRGERPSKSVKLSRKKPLKPQRFWGRHFTEEELKPLALKGLSMHEAATALDCSPALLALRCKETTGVTWAQYKRLVRAGLSSGVSPAEKKSTAAP